MEKKCTSGGEKILAINYMTFSDVFLYIFFLVGVFMHIGKFCFNSFGEEFCIIVLFIIEYILIFHVFGGKERIKDTNLA